MLREDSKEVLCSSVFPDLRKNITIKNKQAHTKEHTNIQKKQPRQPNKTDKVGQTENNLLERCKQGKNTEAGQGEIKKEKNKVNHAQEMKHILQV